MKPHKDELTAMKRWIRPLLIGGMAGMLACMLLMFVLAGVLAAKDVPQSAIQPLAVCAAAVGSLLGGFVCAKLAGERGWLLGLLCGLLLYVALLLAGGFTLLRGGAGWLIRLAALPGAAMLGGMLGVYKRRDAHRRR